MSVKSTINTNLKMMTKVLVVFVLLATSSISSLANSAEANQLSIVKSLNKAKYYFDGAGKSVVEDVSIDKESNLTLDIVVTPSTIKKQSAIAEYGNATNGYRLLQDGRNIVLQANINGYTYETNATNTLDKGESVLLSTHYKDGNISVSINGKTPVNTFYQIDLEKINAAKVDVNLLKRLSQLKNESYDDLSAFTKVLRKTLGRKNYKKHSTEIIKLARHEQELKSIYIGDNFSNSSSSLHVGNNFAGTVEQVRLWQPTKMFLCTKSVELSEKEPKHFSLKLPEIELCLLAVMKGGQLTEQLAKEVGCEVAEEGRSENINFLAIRFNNQIVDKSFKTILSTEKEYHAKVNFSAKLTGFENVQVNASHNFFSLRYKEIALAYPLFTIEDVWNLNTLNYVNINSVNNFEFSTTSKLFNTIESHKTDLENDLVNSAEDLDSKKSLLKFVAKFKSNENQNKLYDFQKTLLVSRRDQFEKLIIEIEEPNAPDLVIRNTAEGIIYTKNSNLRSFDISGEDVRSSEISSLKRLKYVNQNLGVNTSFKNYLFTTNTYSKKNINYSDISSNESSEQISELLVTTNTTKIGYHNYWCLWKVFERGGRSRHEIEKHNQANYYKLLKLNSNWLDCHEVVANLIDVDNENCTRTTRNYFITTDWSSNSKLLNSCKLLKEYEGPPDIPDWYENNFVDRYVSDVDIQYGLG